MAARDPSLHKGHRERMRKQLIKNGFDAFNEHQKLELLLFYAVPRRDTNELAHRILDECGGRLCDVFDSSYEKLRSIKGSSEIVAAFLKLMPQVAAYYLSSKQLGKGELIVENLDVLCSYFEALFVNVCTEEVHVAAVTKELELVREKKIAEGSIGSVTVLPRKILDFASESNCENIVLAHNHPQGKPFATKEDAAVTKRLIGIFRPFGIRIVDHIVVGKGGSQSLRSSMSANKIWDIFDDDDGLWNAGLELE